MKTRKVTGRPVNEPVKDGWQPITVLVPAEVKRQLIDIAARERRSMSSAALLRIESALELEKAS
jgi:hypothetical protein